MSRDAQRETILVTGGGGFLGKAIVQRLAAAGHRVRSFCRHRYDVLEQLGVEQVCGDIADAAAVDSACRDVDTVFHVAAKPGVWGPYQVYYRTNTVGTENVISACRRRKVQRLIYTSSPSVVFDGRDMEGVDETAPYPSRYAAAYPATKALAEQTVRRAAAEGLPAIILRPHLIWGPGDNHLVPRILSRAKRLRRIGSRPNLVDTVYIDNAADAHLLAAEQLNRNPSLSGKVYFISQGQPVPLWQMVDDILAAGGKPPVRKTISASAARPIGGAMEIIWRVLHFPGEPPMTRFMVEELTAAHWFDISAARRDLGYQPRITIAQGLERLRQWLQGGSDH